MTTNEEKNLPDILSIIDEENTLGVPDGYELKAVKRGCEIGIHQLHLPRGLSPEYFRKLRNHPDVVPLMDKFSIFNREFEYLTAQECERLQAAMKEVIGEQVLEETITREDDLLKFMQEANEAMRFEKLRSLSDDHFIDKEEDGRMVTLAEKYGSGEYALMRRKY